MGYKLTYPFIYHSIRLVYTIVLIEKSPCLFSKLPDHYSHRFSQKSDASLSMETLRNYIFIPLDIFQKKHQNENIFTEPEAWLTVLSTEEIMGIFAEELADMDRNSADYMIDRLKRERERLLKENKTSG